MQEFRTTRAKGRRRLQRHLRFHYPTCIILCVESTHPSSQMRGRERHDSTPTAARLKRLYGCLKDQIAVSGGQFSGTSAGGLVHGSSTKASWNQCSRRFACSVTINWKPGTSFWVNSSNSSNSRRTALRSASASVLCTEPSAFL